MKKDTTTTDKTKALDDVMKQIEKQFGKGAIMKLGSEEHLDVEATSSGSLGLDIALGIGGYPKGRIIEIFGPESSGKTTFALEAIAACQKAGGSGYAARNDFDCHLYGKGGRRAEGPNPEGNRWHCCETRCRR